MSAFTVAKILDARLTNFYPLSYRALETLDPILSNTGFLMYVNFLGIILNITRAEKFYYNSWRAIRLFIVSLLVTYAILQFYSTDPGLSDALITVSSFSIIGYGTVLAFRLFRFIKDTFFRRIITGTVIAVVGVLAGLVVNAFIFKEKLATSSSTQLNISSFAAGSYWLVIDKNRVIMHTQKLIKQ